MVMTCTATTKKGKIIIRTVKRKKDGRGGEAVGELLPV
jgi:hypothetical protein